MPFTSIVDPHSLNSDQQNSRVCECTITSAFHRKLSHIVQPSSIDWFRLSTHQAPIFYTFTPPNLISTLPFIFSAPRPGSLFGPGSFFFCAFRCSDPLPTSLLRICKMMQHLCEWPFVSPPSASVSSPSCRGGVLFYVRSEGYHLVELNMVHCHSLISS